MKNKKNKLKFIIFFCIELIEMIMYCIYVTMKQLSLFMLYIIFCNVNYNSSNLFIAVPLVIVGCLRSLYKIDYYLNKLSINVKNLKKQYLK